LLCNPKYLSFGERICSRKQDIPPAISQYVDERIIANALIET